MASGVESLIKFQQDLTLNYQETKLDIFLQDIKNRMDKDLKEMATGVGKEIIDADLVGKIFNDNFNQKFADSITKKIQEEFSALGSNFHSFGDFKSTSSSYIKEIVESEGEKDYSRIINELKILSKMAFGEKAQKLQLIDSSNFKTFFTELQGLFGNSEDVKTYVTNCKKISDAMGGTVPDGKKIADVIYGNLLKLVGEGLWERVAASVRQEIAEVEENEIFKVIENAWIASGGQLKRINIESKAIGSTRQAGSSSQEVADTLFQITIHGTKNGKQVSGTISLFDTTKFTRRNVMKVSSTADLANETKNVGLDEALKAVNQYNYWYQKRQPYLSRPNSPGNEIVLSSEDNSNWINTKQTIIVKYIYDILAVRGNQIRFANTMTIDEKMITIENLIKNYWDFIADSSGVKTTIGGFDAILRNQKGIGTNIFTGYDKYIEKQKSISSGATKSDEQDLWNNFKNSWSLIEKKKISISINAVRGF